MTKRLYFDDAYLRAFDARVVARAMRAGRPAVALDRSAFYPEGGGQPGDHGLLDDVPVVDTQSEDDVVWHLLDGGLAADEVHGSIDWARRFDFMQQHHGQHLLSAAFEQLYDAATVAVHMGEELCTVDVARPAFSAGEVAAAEELANQIIWEDHPIDARFVDGATLATLPLRKPPGTYAQIRIVSVDGFDHSACGGTHPRHTGEVGSIVVRRWERRGETTRLEFVCGGRALHDYRWKNGLIANLAGALSVGAGELPDAIARLREAEERSRKALRAAEEQLIASEAQALLANAERIDGAPVVVQQFVDRQLDSIRRLAGQIAAGGGIALLAGSGVQAQLVYARAAGLPYDMGAILRRTVTIIGGRGGGRPESAQGGGSDNDRIPEALQAARAILAGGE
jgi:alanyl-tRNA synthetase